MPYLCKDCSHRGIKSGQMGECPACGSYNLVKRPFVFAQQKAPAKWRIVLLVVLWGYLLLTVAGKLIN